MAHLRTQLATFCGVAALVALIAAVTPGTGHTQGGAQARPPQDVVVINSDMNPVPAAVVGTPTVNVGNTPTVDVGTMPAITLAGPVSVAGMVGVSPVRPFQVNGHQSADGELSVSVISQQHNVPAGKDFLATWVSVRARSTEGDRIRRVELSELTGPGGIAAFLPFQELVPGTVIATAHVNMVLPFRFFVSALRSVNTGRLEIDYTVSGYLVDEPQP